MSDEVDFDMLGGESEKNNEGTLMSSNNADDNSGRNINAEKNSNINDNDEDGSSGNENGKDTLDVDNSNTNSDGDYAVDSGEDEDSDGEDEGDEGNDNTGDTDSIKDDGGESNIRTEKKKRKKDKKDKKKRKRDREGDLDEDGDVNKKKKKKSKKISKRSKSLAARMFSEEADVADDDEEEEEDYGEVPDDERVLDYEEQAAIEAVEKRHKGAREYQAKSAEEIAEEIERRHREEERIKQRYESQDGFGGHMGTDAVAQQSLLPSVTDPKIFKLRCKAGQEQLIVRALMLKALDVCNHTGQLKIKSAFCSGTKGFVYIEAVSEAFAKELILGLRSIYATTFAQVPVSEMTSVLVSTVVKKPFKVGQFVRLKRGPLKGDLARIISLHEGDTKAFIQAVPRPDYSADGTTGKGGKTGVGMTVRPPQRLFDPEEARSAGSSFVYRRHHPLDQSATQYDLWNNDYYKHGFLFKEVNVTTYLDNTNSIKPRLEELQMFRQQNKSQDRTHDDADGNDDEDLDGIHSTDPNSSFMKDLAAQIQSLGDEEEKEGPSIFLPGDLVLVTKGEMRNLVARVTAVNDATRIARIVPYENKELSTEMEIEIDLLVKHIFPGAHIKVVSGRYMGQTGRVVSVEMKDGQNIASVLTDGINTELQCNVKHLQMSSEVTTGHGDLLGYELYDLVALNENECAVVIMVGAEQLRVINHMGVVKDVSPMELRGKRNTFSRRSTGFDKQQNTMSVGDTVKVLTGSHAKLSGTIKHMMKGTVWLHSNSYLKDSGVFVCKTRDCLIAGGKAPTPIMSANYKGVLQPSPAHSVGSSSASPAIGGRPPPRGTRDDTVGMTVKITKGSFKGMLAQVVDATPTHFSLELLARMKKIVIERSKAVPVGDAGGSLTRQDDRKRQQAAQIAGGTTIPATPFLGMPTPMAMNGSETPRYAVGGETPMHFGDATPSRTPGREEADALWQVNEADLALSNDTSTVGTFSVSSSMMNSPGSLFSRNNTSLPASDWGSTGASGYQSSTNYSNYSTGETPMGTGYGSINSNVAEVGSVRSGTSGVNSYALSVGDASQITEQSNSSTNISHHEWKRNMVVEILKGEYKRRFGVLQDSMNPNGNFHVSLKDGERLGRGMDIHFGDLRLAEVLRKDRVMVLSGKYKGAEGIVKSVQRRDVFVLLDGGSSPVIIKSNNLACLHVEYRR